MNSRPLLLALALSATLLRPAPAQEQADSSRVTLAALYSSGYFRGQWVPPVRWTPDGTGYYLLQ
ncbi:MAG TPA: hypothetical protein VNH46_08535, partial [Gemmatimonadales bacterium]|nr:hypothetical protein [Gemmatimonadales bacterium]